MDFGLEVLVEVEVSVGQPGRTSAWQTSAIKSKALRRGVDRKCGLKLGTKMEKLRWKGWVTLR